MYKRNLFLESVLCMTDHIHIHVQYNVKRQGQKFNKK
jgi:hypothetical protein